MKTIEIKKTVTETITFDFPLYTSDGILHYFRFDENGCIAVKIHKLSTPAIEDYNSNIYPDSWMLFDKISEQEFYSKFEQALNYFKSKYEIR